MALTRSRRHKVFAGVCGGFAEWLSWDPNAVRILYVILSIFPGGGIPGILVYIVLWVVMPTDPR